MNLEAIPNNNEEPSEKEDLRSEHEANSALSHGQELMTEVLKGASPEKMEDPQFRLAAENTLNEKFNELDQLGKSDEEIKVALEDELNKLSQF